MRRWFVAASAMIVAITLLAPAVRRLTHGFTVVVRAADLQGPVRRVADIDVVAVREDIVRATIEDGATIRLRVYAPLDSSRQTVLLVSGLHPAGIDEPRLMRLARRLAETGLTVATPDIPELSRFEITPVLTDRIEALALWLATASGLAPNGRIGLMGVSFSGGLAVVAAGRPALRNHLSYVFSFGGHDDLRRVLDYFSAGSERDTLAPHDYGVAIVALNMAERLVPADQLGEFRDAMRRFLWASYLDTTSKPEADREFAALRELARMLPEPSATLLGYVNDRDVASLGLLLRPCLAEYVDAPPLSPSRSPAPAVPVFLLHGRDDTVIPATESQHLAQRLHGIVPVHLLITDLISHAEADQPAHVGDVLRLARFWGELLDQ